MKSADERKLELPSNVRLGPGSVITGATAFARFHGREDVGLRVGARCNIEEVRLQVGWNGWIEIGDSCHLSHVSLFCEQEIVIGSFVAVGWNATILDCDFHPASPRHRIIDALAFSPLGDGRQHSERASAPVYIEDEVYIGPNALILKGVRIGRGAFIEPGSVVTRDVSPETRVAGNPAVVVQGQQG
jgi:acetyltransferase-like isoleucine patch superfamily enzyme